VLLADSAQRHVAIEVAPIRVTEVELATLAKATSDRLGFPMEITCGRAGACVVEIFIGSSMNDLVVVVCDAHVD
jgi:hypothetical protein